MPTASAKAESWQDEKRIEITNRALAQCEGPIFLKALSLKIKKRTRHAHSRRRP